VIDEAFDAAQALREREHLESLEEMPRFGEPAFQEERHDAAAARGHLPARERVLRVRREPRVKHPLDARVALQPACDLERGLARAAHAQRKRLEAAQRKKAVERAADGADRVLQETDPLTELRVADN